MIPFHSRESLPRPTETFSSVLLPRWEEEVEEGE